MCCGSGWFSGARVVSKRALTSLIRGCTDEDPGMFLVLSGAAAHDRVRFWYRSRVVRVSFSRDRGCCGDVTIQGPTWLSEE